jgi:hypothetical protein
MRFAVFGACSIMLEKTYEQAHAEFVIIIFFFCLFFFDFYS